MTNSRQIPLGKNSSYPTAYDPGLLFSIDRDENRAELSLGPDLPFYGHDHWRAYELSWLDVSGMPIVAMADILIPATSPMLVESKSMKLYLNSLNQHVIASAQSANELIVADISNAAGVPVTVQIKLLSCMNDELAHTNPLPATVTLIDDLTVNIQKFQPTPELLTLDSEGPQLVRETLASHLFRSRCPVTSQPDWGSIVVDYSGPKISRQALLQYVISFREHEGFHEHCVEQIFCDIMRRCEPFELTVSINFLRRGGLEINPIRSTLVDLQQIVLPRLVRQ
jgi:7-cyano-7-deazaguanine reductase